MEIGADEIATNLPEIAQALVAPLFELFEFFEIPVTLPAEEINRMFGRNG